VFPLDEADVKLKVDGSVNTFVVGAHVIVCGDSETVNEKFELSAPYVGVEAEVTITVQAPAPVYVSTPVAALTEHPAVFPLPDTAYVIAPPLLDTAPAAGV
jgi:hypothetical protein